MRLACYWIQWDWIQQKYYNYNKDHVPHVDKESAQCYKRGLNIKFWRICHTFSKIAAFTAGSFTSWFNLTFILMVCSFVKSESRNAQTYIKLNCILKATKSHKKYEPEQDFNSPLRQKKGIIWEHCAASTWPLIKLPQLSVFPTPHGFPDTQLMVEKLLWSDHFQRSLNRPTQESEVTICWIIVFSCSSLTLARSVWCVLQ